MPTVVPAVVTAPRCGHDRWWPRLKPTIEVIPDRGRLILMRSGRQNGDVALDGDPRVLGELLAQLDGTRGPASILASLRATVAPALTAEDLDEALRALAADGLIEDATDDARHLDPAGLERYDRQLRYFGDLAGAGMPRAAAQARLEAATVAVLGLGGLGGMAATMLTVCGVGTIVGVDHDVVELSNLARQVLYGQDDLGRLKVDAAADRLSQLNARGHFVGIPRRLDSTAAVADAIAGADFVVAAVDWPADRISGWVNAACWAAGIPYVGMSQHPPLVRVGPTYLPGATGCLTCQEAAYRRRFPLFDAARSAISDDSPAATYAPACGLIGSLVANEAIAHITGLTPVACLGRSTVIDLTTLAVTHEEVPRDPDCGVCGRGAVSTMRPAASPIG
ncbi:TOMM precursor leader peptide-binding protein [Baekduia sp.]|jgi:bacteriocin biosynthesis cyclodehydratase domain-containing protein|uniref:TOMM precursor leader peptide-binding protein n=1 Tax=Baekduia sp. TaxID=2600305 RepID=UPI002E008777|nr:TOMM precursor leader peptide-binding protein [Baekduia sp.]